MDVYLLFSRECIIKKLQYKFIINLYFFNYILCIVLSRQCIDAGNLFLYDLNHYPKTIHDFMYRFNASDFCNRLWFYVSTKMKRINGRNGTWNVI